MNLVPKTAHFYWGLTPMPYVRYLSMFTFAALNKDWQINMYFPTLPASSRADAYNVSREERKVDKDYRERLSLIPNVAIKEIDFTMFGEWTRDFSDVHRSDLLRYYLLSTCGGVWSDTDVLYLKPIPENLFHANANAYLIRYEQRPAKEMAIGFLAATKGSDFFSTAIQMVKTKYTMEYQSIGRFLLEAISQTQNEVAFLPARTVYPIEPLDDAAFRKILLDKNEIDIPLDCIGIHWFAGHPYAASLYCIASSDDVKKSELGLMRLVQNLI